MKEFNGSYIHLVRTGKMQECYEVSFTANVNTKLSYSEPDRYDGFEYTSIIRLRDKVDILKDLQIFGSVDYFEECTYEAIHMQDPYPVEDSYRPRYNSIKTAYN